MQGFSQYNCIVAYYAATIV